MRFKKINPQILQGRAAGIGITSKAESSINADKLAITPTTAQDTNKSNSSGQDGSSEEQKRDDRRKSSSTNVANKKNSVQQKKSKDAKNNKKDDSGNADKSERSSSPAFESDEDSSGNDKQPAVQTLAVPLTKKRPSIAGLLVSVAVLIFYFLINIRYLRFWN